MSVFFHDPETANDPIYRRICKASTSIPEAQAPLEQARDFVESTWADCGQFIESGAPERARQDFCPVWWELYLASCLHHAGVSLIPSAERVHQGKGRPDLLAKAPRVWIEAVMPTPGDGPDALTEPESGAVFRVPTDAFVLRLRTAIEEKTSKLGRYIEDGTVSCADATIIAVSGGRLPFRFNEQPIPSIVRAVLAVGSLTLEIDCATKAIVGRSVEYHGHVVKQSKALVETDVFLQKEYAHVSAVLYSSSDCVNHPKNPGEDFILVHNPNAEVPVPNDWLLIGDQYWVEADTLCRKRAGHWSRALRYWRLLHRALRRLAGCRVPHPLPPL